MRVLLVTHEASLSGAPRVALMVARMLVERGDDVRVLSCKPGPVIADFRSVAPTGVEAFWRVRRRLWRRWPSGIALVVDTVLATLTLLLRRPDLVYLNSTAASVYLRPALWLRRRVVLHSHESTEVARFFLEPRRAMPLLRRARLVACSPSVHISLCDLAEVGPDEVVLAPSVPDSDRVLALAAGPAPDLAAPGEIVVGCCGSAEKRKGVDLWLQVASSVQAALPDVPLRFVWVGDTDPEASAAAGPRVEFTGPTSNPYPAVARFDIATLPSRDDPFPLVVLEAMLLGRPMVAFAVGGVPEQVGDAGILVPPLDVEAFAAAVRDLVEDPQRRAALGRAAVERARDLYSTEAFRKRLDAALDPAPLVASR